jgi:hypothetical protein
MAVAQKKHVKTNGPRSAPGGPFQGPFVEVNGCLDLLVIWSLPATPPSEITATPPTVTVPEHTPPATPPEQTPPVTLPAQPQ